MNVCMVSFSKTFPASFSVKNGLQFLRKEMFGHMVRLAHVLEKMIWFDQVNFCSESNLLADDWLQNDKMLNYIALP